MSWIHGLRLMGEFSWIHVGVCLEFIGGYRFRFMGVCRINEGVSSQIHEEMSPIHRYDRDSWGSMYWIHDVGFMRKYDLGFRFGLMISDS
ncbi:hypothetical protein QJS04_geneDACA018578 [Acorus gramineus]|uniref:Uncharacterized protein n=1 Tax=Acorus gramineus TaxID=55184 RepID=A0AAV9AF79_ACOGR|nr:hypothetical protein QJS04_geneDACA018578 [Acorus gramineus]